VGGQISSGQLTVTADISKFYLWQIPRNFFLPGAPCWHLQASLKHLQATLLALSKDLRDMARPRLSDAHHALVGGKYRDRAKTTESKHSADVPKMPSYLSTGDARREWRRLLPLLTERGSLTAGDAQGLALHCETFARWIACQKQITAEGLMQTTSVLDRHGAQVTRTKPHPCLRIAMDCERSLRISLASMGLTPQSREKIVPAKPVEKEEESNFSKMMRESK
jgi:P27 family predicted phage terminase small subunit